MENIKLYGVTLAYNEAKMIPYVMAYHERLGFDKLIVYDNESTDNTVELIKQYPFVEVRTFSTGNHMDDETHSKLKSDTIREFAGEENAWLYVGDFDEVLYYNGNFKDFLSAMDSSGCTYYNGQLINLVRREFPETDKLAHETADIFNYFGDGGNKTTLIKASGSRSVRFTPGAHSVTVSHTLPAKSINSVTSDLKAFHLKFIDYNNAINKMKNAVLRFSDRNKQCGYGSHYYRNSKDAEYARQWEQRMRDAIDKETYLNGTLNMPFNSSSYVRWHR